ncbi:uridine kinase [Saccharothrix coeruleofusca]|uniref:Uridine kinase n=1 Tax=Saccharothrix coeruleofusca TaxID=33919 RepID=A0A918AIT6_9PSEU|nr:uridine kinase [Saccharothrix coeruleofusca]GGP43510.1 uridine kinase [Saccharothrix coeruleofusca]
MKVTPLSPETLVAELVDRIDALPRDGHARVVVDGATATNPHELADALVDPLRALGRPVLRVSAKDFLRPASVRLEHGRTDPESFRHSWTDTGGLLREVLEPLDPGGSGRVLPALWNAETDRASRADYVALAPGGVLLLDGTLLLDKWLPFELAVHLWLSPGALRRRTPPEWQWTLPAYDDYEPQADLVVRYDHPTRPALVGTVEG